MGLTAAFFVWEGVPFGAGDGGFRPADCGFGSGGELAVHPAGRFAGGAFPNGAVFGNGTKPTAVAAGMIEADRKSVV